MSRITVEDCLKIIPNRFELVVIAAERARALMSGSFSNLNIKNRPAVVALREIAGGYINIDKIKDNIIKREFTSSDSTSSLDVVIDSFLSKKYHSFLGKETEDIEVKSNVDIDMNSFSDFEIENEEK